jgi:hypothetical protein
MSVKAARWLARTKNISYDEAMGIYDEAGQERKQAFRERAEADEAQRRRKAAGNPVYRPRNDFVGVPRKA